MTNPTPIDPISAAHVVEDQAQSLRDAMETAKHWLTANTQLDASMRFVRAYSILNQALEGRLGDLDQLAKELRESAPSESAGRGLEDIFKDIRAEGHMVQLSIHDDGHAYLSTWRAGVEAKDSGANWIHDDGDDPAALAEARLAQIRELHAVKEAGEVVADGWAQFSGGDVEQAQAAEPRHYQPGLDPLVTACGTEFPKRTTRRLEHVTCPACRREMPAPWDVPAGPEEVDTEHEALAAEEARRTATASEHLEDATDADDGVVDGEGG